MPSADRMAAEICSSPAAGHFRRKQKRTQRGTVAFRREGCVQILFLKRSGAHLSGRLRLRFERRFPPPRDSTAETVPAASAAKSAVQMQQAVKRAASRCALRHTSIVSSTANASST